MPNKINQYINQDTEPKGYIKSAGDGAVLGVLDLWQVVTHPHEAIKAVASLISDSSTLLVGVQDPVAEQNMKQRKESIANAYYKFKNANGPKRSEYIARFLAGGAGASAIISKIAKIISKVKTSGAPVKASYNTPQERKLYFLDLHQNYIKSAETNTIKKTARSSEDMLEDLSNSQPKKTLSPNNPYGYAAIPLINGASDDKSETDSGGFSFFNEARGEEHHTQEKKPDQEQPKQSSEKNAEQPRQKRFTKTKDNSKKNEQKRDEKLKTFANAYGFNLNDLNDDSQKELKDILEKQDAANRQRTFSDRLNSAKGTFESILSLGLSLNNKDLIRTGDIGLKTLELGEATLNLQHIFPSIKSLTDPNGPIGMALASIGSAHPYLAFAAAAVQLGMAIFKRPQEDPFKKEVMAYLKATLEYLQAVRKEMHMRFDRLEGLMKYMFDAMLDKLDAYIEALTTLINANHELQLKGMVYLESILQKDIKPALAANEKLIIDMKLIDVDLVLKHIQAHTHNKINKSDVKTKLDELEALDRELGTYLEGILVSTSVNGASKVTANAIPDPAYIIDALQNNRIPLGFLGRFAKFYLNMEDNLKDINTDRFPLLQYWPHALAGHIASLIFGSQQYGATMDTQDNNELINIANNTRAFIETLTTHASELFQGIFSHYINSVVSLNDEFTKSMKNTIKNDNDYKFTFKEAVEKGWIVMPSLYNEKSIKKLLADPGAIKAELPAVLFLAMKLGLVNLTSVPNYKPTPGNYGGGGNAGERMRRVQRTLLQANVKLAFNVTILNTTNTLDNIIYIESDKLRDYKNIEISRDDYDSYINSYKNEVEAQNAWKEQQVVENTSVTAFAISPTLKRDLNIEILDKVVEILVNNIQNNVDMTQQIGADLTNIANTLFSQALKTLTLNRASYAEDETKVKLCQAIATAYARAIGFNSTVQEQIQLSLESDTKIILSSPGQYLKAIKVNETLANITQTDPEIITYNPIVHQMDAAILTMNNFKALSYLHEGYFKNLQQWNHDLAYYQQLDQSLIQMRELSVEGFDFFNQATISALIQKLHYQRHHFEESYQSLMDMYNQLNTYGFPVQKPRNVEEAFQIVLQSENTPPRRGVGLPDLRKTTLFEIIEKSGNPYLDTKMFLESCTFESAVAHTNTVDSSGKSPLHHAAILADSELIEVLIQFDAPIALKDKTGKTAPDYLPKHAKESRTLLRSRSGLQAEQKVLGYSINQAISVFREVLLEIIHTLEESDNPAVIFNGDTGGGKSAMISFLAGTNYKLIIDKNLCENIAPDNDVPEVAERGNIKSETKVPKRIPLSGLDVIDVAGDYDTQGTLRDMIKDFLHAILMKKQKVTKAHAIVIADKFIFDERMVNVRARLTKIGQNIKNDPARLIKHIILVISKPNRALRLDVLKGDPIAYEQHVFNQLMVLKDSLGIVSETHPDHDMLIALEYLTQENIFLGDVTNPKTRERMFAKLDKMPITPSEDFNFSDLRNQAEPFKRLINMVIEDLQATENKIKNNVGILGNHWQTQLNISTYHQEDLGEFENDPSLHVLKSPEEQMQTMHHDLMTISNLLTQELKPFNQTTGSIVGDTLIVTEELSELMREVQQQKQLVTELGDLSIQLNLTIPDTIKQMVENAKPEPTHTELRIEGEPRCYELETAISYPCLPPPENANQENEPNNEPSGWETKQGYADQINDYLIVFKYAAHYLGYLSPYHWSRIPNESEKQTLESSLAQIRTYTKPLEKLTKSALNDVKLFDDNIRVINSNIQNMTESIHNILTTDNTTTHQLAQIQESLIKTQSMLIELTDLNKELHKMRGKVGPNERIVIGRARWSDQLILTKETIPDNFVPEYKDFLTAPTFQDLLGVPTASPFTTSWRTPGNSTPLIAGNNSNVVKSTNHAHFKQNQTITRK